MDENELRKIIREEIIRAMQGFFGEKRLSDMEESLDPQRNRDVPYPVRHLDFQVNRLAFLTDKFMLAAESWNDEKCLYCEKDIQHIKAVVDQL